MADLKQEFDLNNYTKVDLIFQNLVYSQEFKTIICTICKYSLGLSNNIYRHLKESHYTKIEYSLIKNKLEPIINNLELKDNNNLLTPLNYKYNFKDLINYNGFNCLNCSFLTINYKNIKQHLNIEHNIKENNNNNNLKNYYKESILQAFNSNRKYRQYFIININIIQQDLNSNNNNYLINFKTNYNNIIKESLDNKINLITKQITPFLYNSKFHEYLINKNKQDLLLLLKKPEITINNIQSRIINLINNICFNLITKLEKLINIINRSYKQRLNSETLNSIIPNLKPFKLVEESTKKVYNIIFPNYLIYIFNLYYQRLNNKGKDNIILEPNIDIINLNIENIIEILTNNIQNDLINKNINLYKENILLIESILIDLFIKLLEQDTKQKSFKEISLFNSSIFTYLILLSLDVNNLTFKKEIYIEQYTSQLIYNFRLFFLGFLKAKEEEASNNQLEFNFDLEFNIYFPLYLTNTSYNIFTELTQIRALTNKIASTTTSISRIIDISDDIIAIDNKQISISKLKNYFQILLIKLEDLLFKNLLFLNKTDIELNLDILKDDPNNNTPGFSFFNYINNNQDLTLYKDLLINKLLNNNTYISKLLLKDITNLKFNNKNIETLYKNRIQFLELLYLAIYLTSGSPLRGSELILINYINTLTQPQRNILIESRKPEFIKINTTYNKSYNINRINKTNIRFLNIRLSQILKLYLILFIPLYNFINFNYFKINKVSSYLFENKGSLFTIPTLSNLLGLETLKYLGETITINPYRHLIKYIIKERLLLDYNSDSDNNLIEDIQANHSTKTSNLIYSREITIDSNSSSYILKKSLDFNIKFFNYFNLNQEIIINNSNYKKHQRNKSSIINISNKKTKLETNINRDLLDFNLIKNINLEDYLKQFFNNPNAVFNNKEQKQAIQAILNKEAFITYISGTGTGKSLLFFLPYYINSNIIQIIISPRVSLKEDLLNRSIKYNLKGEIFNKNLKPTNNLLFLGFEDLETIQFNNYINNLIANKQEFNIYFDEAHLIILEENFRYIIKYINNIIKFKNNLIFISATMPNKLLTLLEEKFNIINNTIIRGSTSRINISYNIQILNKNENILIKLKTLFNSLLLKLKEKEKIIIFVTTEQACNTISKQLQIPCYYSKLLNKEIILKDYFNNINIKAIVATNALGVGLDYNCIRYSIHPYKINSLINLDQEIGRIGRDNKLSIAYIFVNLNNYYYKAFDNKTSLEYLEIEDNNKIVEFIKEQKCYRIILDKYFNNKLTNYCIEPNTFCSLCLKRKQILETSYNKEVEKEININNINNKLINLLNKIRQICFVCLLNKNINYNKHSLYNCLNSKEFIFIVRDLEKNYIKKQKLLKPGTCCYQCFLPNIICFNKLIKTNNCELQYTILETIVFLNQLTIKYKSNNYIFNNFKDFLNIKDLLEFSKLICLPIKYSNCDAINALLYIEKIELDIINNIIFNYNNPNIITSPNNLISLETLFNSSNNTNINLDINIKELDLNKSSLNISQKSSNYDSDSDLDNTIIELFNTNKSNINSDYFKYKFIQLNQEYLKYKHLPYIRFLEKLDYYIQDCLFCFFNKDSNKVIKIKHLTTNCFNNLDIIKAIKEFYLPLANKSYSKELKEEELNIKNNINYIRKKALNLDINCLLPSSICQFSRSIYYKSKRIIYCNLELKVFIILFIIIKNKKTNLIPYYYYSQEKADDIWSYISNKGLNYYNLESSIALEIIANISLNKNDLILDFNYNNKDKEKYIKLVQDIKDLKKDNN